MVGFFHGQPLVFRGDFMSFPGRKPWIQKKESSKCSRLSEAETPRKTNGWKVHFQLKYHANLRGPPQCHPPKKWVWYILASGPPPIVSSVESLRRIYTKDVVDLGHLLHQWSQRMHVASLFSLLLQVCILHSDRFRSYHINCLQSGDLRYGLEVML